MTWWQAGLVSAGGGVVALVLKFISGYLLQLVKLGDEKKTQIHRVQFEKEFASYIDIWHHVPDIRSYIVSHDCCMTPEYEQRRKTELPALLATLSASIAQAEPFLYPDVFEACVLFLGANNSFKGITEKLDKLSESVDRMARRQNGQVSADEKRLDKLLDDWFDSLQQVVDRAEDIKDSIQKRIWNS